MDERTKNVTDRLMAQCSRREYCSHDVFQKALKALDGNSDEASEVLEKLVSENYVDDLRYASAYAREKSSITGWGAVKIKYTLASKGISKDIIEQALSEIDCMKAGSRLYKLMENKYKSLKQDPQADLKMIRFALGRGYSYEEVRGVLKNIKTDEQI